MSRVLEDHAGFVFGDLRPHRIDVGLPHRIGRACADVGVEGAALEQMAHQLFRALRSANVERAPPGSESSPRSRRTAVRRRGRDAGASEEMRDVGRIDVDAHHLPRRAMAAVEQEMPAVVQGEQDRGVAAVRIGQRSPGAEQDDPHRRLPSNLETIGDSGDNQK